jgi:hypothetical protein
VFLEGREEVEGVCDKRPLSNQIEHLAVYEVDELVKDVNPISLKARPAEDVEGDESTTNSSSEEEFASSTCACNNLSCGNMMYLFIHFTILVFKC